MPITPLRASARARAAIAGVIALAAAGGGYITLSTGEKVPPQVVLAMNTLEPWEETQLRAYLDKLPKPPVWTICAGDTKNVRAGMVETREGCDKRLRTRLINDYYKPLTRCIPGFDARPVSWGAMMISLSWNVGVGAACKSTAARLGKEGRYRESCDAATAFNKAGGKVIRGLVLRREMGDASRIGEGELCVTGLSMAVAPPVPAPETAPAAENRPNEPAPPVQPGAEVSSAPGYLAAAAILAAVAAIGFLIWRRTTKRKRT